MRNVGWLSTVFSVCGGLLGTGGGLSLAWWRATSGAHLGATGQILGELLVFPALGSGLGAVAGYHAGRALATRRRPD